MLEGRIEPGRVFDRIVGLDGVPDGYRAMNEREVDQGDGEALMAPHAVRRTVLLAAALSACIVAAGAHAQPGGAGPALVYDAQTRGPVPIPPSERGLQTVVAEPWFKVSDTDGAQPRVPPSTGTATCSSAT